MRLLSLIQTLLLFLFFALGFSLSTCAPLPKEGEYKEELQLTLQLQTRNSNRLGRTNSISKRKSEFVVLAPATATFSKTAPSFTYSIDVDLATNTTKPLSVAANTYTIFLYRFGTSITLSDFKSYLSSGTIPAALDYGVSTKTLTVPSNSYQVTIQLQKETVFLDSPVEGLNYTAGGITGTTDQDGLIYYFPDKPINLTLGSLDLGTFTNPGLTLTPYDVMGVVEGTAADNITNFARLLQSLDNDSNPENGIQLSSTPILPGSVTTLDNFSTNSNFSGLAVTAEKATNHLARSMHYKNQTNFEVLFKLPDNRTDNVSTNSLIAIAFNQPLRKGDLAATLTLDGTDLPVHAVEGNWLLFQPTLTPGISYQASLNSAVSFTGDNLTSPVTWSFTASSSSTQPLPKILKLSPDNGTNNHPTDTVPTITFNGPVFPVSGTIQFTLDNGSSVPCSPIIQGVSVSCIPNAPLSADTYIATLAAGTLKSIDGVTNNQVRWQFTTGSATSSGGASLRHLGEFNDNVTNGSVVMLHVGNGGKHYRLKVGGNPTDWQYPIFYPVHVPLQLTETEGVQNVSVDYRDNSSDTSYVSQSLNITLDKTPPVPFLTLPPLTNQTTLPYLMMANDNLSGTWRYFVDNCSVQPEKDFESWINFPAIPAVPQALWDNVTATNAGLNCISQADLQNFSNGNSHYPNINCTATTSATKSNFETYLPAWDNQTLDLSVLSAGDNQTQCLWVMDKAGNMGVMQQTVVYNPSLDLSPPSISSSSSLTAFSITDNFSVTFDEELDNSSINATTVLLQVKDLNGNLINVSGSVYYDNSTFTIIFDPNQDLLSFDNYTLILTSGIRDKANNSIITTHFPFQTGFAGSGTSTSPFLVPNATALDRVRDNLTAHYKLTSDIDLSGISNWNPIGPSFEGSFNGDNKTIKNLRIDNSTGTYVGLFSKIQSTAGGAIVENIKFTNSFVRGQNDVGTVAGLLADSYGTNPTNTIRNVIIDNATVEGNSNLGGLVGQAYGLIEQVGIKQLKLFITSTVTNANANAGGLVGDLYDGQIKESFAEGIIDNQSGNNKGGLIGMIRGSSTTNPASLENSYAHVNVTGNIRVGSLIGNIQNAKRLD